MKNLSFVTAIAGLLMLTASCRLENNIEPAKQDMPSITNLDSLKETAFVPTLESYIDSNKNIVYTPTLLYAWDKVETELKDKVMLSDTNSQDFTLLTKSTSYKNALLDSEYTAAPRI